MSFLIHFNIRNFVESLAAGSTVYSLAFVDPSREKPQAIVLLTSDAGVADGRIHVIRIAIETNGEDPLTAAGNASDKLRELLGLTGTTYRTGVLHTAGLQDALRYYGNTGLYTMKELEELIAEEKKGKDK